MANNFDIPHAVYLYNEGVKGIDFKRLRDFIRNNFGKIPVKIVGLKKKVVATKGILFDPIKTKASFDSQASCHIILTDRLFATYGEDKKLHLRASIYGFPSVISTSGIVEGPAKPKDYYIYKDRFSKLGTWGMEEPRVKNRFKGRFIDYQDRRISGILKGYLSQALFFHITGDPFCDNKKCRLFNAHWQEDLIYSQTKRGDFCSAHKKLLRAISRNFSTSAHIDID